MSEILEILKYVLPSAITLLGVYFIIQSFLNDENKRRNHQTRKLITNEQRKISLPLRLQAYERCIVLLERINPISLCQRVYQPNMLVPEFQLELIKTIRLEYEYNLSQQMYLQSESWQMVSLAKEETLKLINAIASKMPDSTDGRELSNAILRYIMESGKEMPVQIAINYLKSDVQSLF